MNLTNSKVSYTVKRAAYNLKDLFNGDEFLGNVFIAIAIHLEHIF